MRVKATVKLALLLAVFNSLSIIVWAKLKIHHERVVLSSYNSTVVDNVKFTYSKINRTTFAISSSYNLLRNILDEDVMVLLKVDEKAGNEYRPTGVAMNMNLCKFYKANTYGIAGDIAKFGNFTVCNLKKGYYYVKDYVPNLSRIPQLIPGSFKLYMKLTHHGAELFELHWYATVAEAISWKRANNIK